MDAEGDRKKDLSEKTREEIQDDLDNRCGFRRSDHAGPRQEGHPFRGKRPGCRSEATLGGSGSGLRGVSPHGGSFELDTMGVVHKPVEDGIAEGGVADDVVPVVDGQLAGDQGGATSVSVLEDLKEISAFGLIEGLESEVVDEERSGPLESVEETGV